LFPWRIHQDEFTTPSPLLNCAKRPSPSNGHIMALRLPCRRSKEFSQIFFQLVAKNAPRRHYKYKNV
jgi:hypothetical protein